MNVTLVSILEAALLVTALSIDAFVASFAYGTNKIKIPFLSVAIINVVCSIILALSLAIGSIIRPFIPTHLTTLLCFFILLALGIVKLFDSTIKSYIRNNNTIDKKINFSLFHLRFILNVYADPKEADQDSSRYLSSMEALSLAAALSFDGLAVGFGAALVNVNIIEVVVLNLLLGTAGVILGGVIGHKIAERFSLNLSWVSGFLLILLAFLKL